MNETWKSTMEIPGYTDVRHLKGVPPELRAGVGDSGLLRAIFNELPDPIFLKDREGRIVLANSAALNAIGKPAEQVLGKTSPEYMEDHEVGLDILKHDLGVLETGVAESVEQSWPGASDERVFLTTRSPLRDAEGRVVGVMGVARDITDRKRSEGALRTSEERFRALAESSLVGIYIYQDGRYAYVNPAMARVFGYSVAEMTGMTAQDIVHPSHHEMVGENIRRRIAGNVHSMHYQVRGRYRDGSVRDVEVYGSTIQLNGRPALVGTLLDITERKRAEEELTRYKLRLEELVQRRTEELTLARDEAVAANQAKSTFLANMSHELRTPLNAILGFSTLISESESASAEHRRNARIVRRSGEQLLDLINDLLDMAKIEAGKVTLESATVDLNDLLLQIRDAMKIRAEEKGLQLTLEQSSEFPRFVRSDIAKLRQILVNLVGNAIKYTERGQVNVRLEGETTPRVFLRLEVADTGIGIAPEDQEKIFNPFVQLGGASTGGTGLGLTIIREYVRVMGGAIEVESAVGRGSRFRVALPVEIAEPIPESTARPHVIGLAPGQPEWRVLVVEDHEESRMLLQQLLKEVGFQVRAAVNGSDAVEVFQSWRPHFIWMDWRLPVMDGGQATECIRRMEGGQAVRITAITASVFADQRAAILASGVDELVIKPFLREEIFECMAQLLGVQYLYGETPAVPAGPAPTELALERLRLLPAPLRKELTDAVISLDLDRIKQVIRQVSQLDGALGGTLDYLADGFMLTRILKALQDLSE